MQKTCKWCGVVFDDKSKRHRVNYCSNECRNARLAQVATRADHSREQAIPNTQCAICGKPIYRPARWYKQGHAEAFCSRACMGIRKRQQMKGNRYSEGIKQTPERIAHRVSFIKGEKNACWNGGVTLRRHGGKIPYRHVKCPPEYRVMARVGGYVAEHRLIIAKHLGRPLLPQEVVHHINHDPLDNRLENLELFPNNAAHKKAEGQSGYFKEFWNRIRTTRQTSLQPNDQAELRLF